LIHRGSPYRLPIVDCQLPMEMFAIGQLAIGNGAIGNP